MDVSLKKKKKRGGKNNVLVLLGVALLPFVDERRLRAALEEVYPDLTPEESKNCNVLLQLVIATVFHPK